MTAHSLSMKVKKRCLTSQLWCPFEEYDERWKCCWNGIFTAWTWVSGRMHSIRWGANDNGKCFVPVCTYVCMCVGPCCVTVCVCVCVCVVRDLRELNANNESGWAAAKRAKREMEAVNKRAQSESGKCTQHEVQRSVCVCVCASPASPHACVCVCEQYLCCILWGSSRLR